MKKQTILIIVVIAILAALWYFFFYKKNQTTTTATIAPGEPSASPVTREAVINGAPSVLATATGASQTLTTAPDVTSPRPVLAVVPGVVSTIDATQFDAVILPWMNNLGVANKQQALKIYPSMTTNEKAALADIILNVWGGKRPQTSDDTLFWNNWRTKYHVLDGTYSPFTGDAQTPYMGVNNLDGDAQTPYAPKSIEPLAPVMNSQQANNFVIKGSSQSAYNGFKGKKSVRKK
jgi:hypothetical protein